MKVIFGICRLITICLKFIIESAIHISRFAPEWVQISAENAPAAIGAGAGKDAGGSRLVDEPGECSQADIACRSDLCVWSEAQCTRRFGGHARQSLRVAQPTCYGEIAISLHPESKAAVDDPCETCLGRSDRDWQNRCDCHLVAHLVAGATRRGEYEIEGSGGRARIVAKQVEIATRAAIVGTKTTENDFTGHRLPYQFLTVIERTNGVEIVTREIRLTKIAVSANSAFYGQVSDKETVADRTPRRTLRAGKTWKQGGIDIEKPNGTGVIVKLRPAPGDLEFLGQRHAIADKRAGADGRSCHELDRAIRLKSDRLGQIHSAAGGKAQGATGQRDAPAA